MSNQTPIYRCFHPLVADAYTTVHQWIESTNKANRYKKLDPRKKSESWSTILRGESLDHVAYQYYRLFPAHYFKASHLLESIIGEDNLIGWLKHKQRICVLDIGCGAGAGTAAFIEAVLVLIETGKLNKNIDIFTLGVDPNKFSILLYKKLLEKLKLESSSLINLDFAYIKNGFPEATLDIIQHLKKERESSQKPCLSNILVIQLNVISPLSQIFRTQENDYNALLELDPEIGTFLVESPERFGTAEAQAYRQMIEDVPVDAMHILTVATTNQESEVQDDTDSQITLEERVNEMMSTLYEVVGQRHVIEQLSCCRHEIYFENPQGSYWKETRKIDKTDNPKTFYAYFQRIISSNLPDDKDWNDVISFDNLKLAWARARNNFLREALCDETEMRLFEMHLDVRLSGLREQLCAYANDVALKDDAIAYKVPKNMTVSRPKGLSRIEEEILSVAVIQKLGDKASQLRGSSYAYRISGNHKSRETEYLYEYWFQAYCFYMTKARDSARNYANGAILRLDIESFYTKIIQSKICDEVARELSVSQRVSWLIRLLLSKEIDGHVLGQGITQGSIGSGFYANLYLTAIDTKFGVGNPWGVEFHRYVDDMILVIPNPADIDEIENVLKEELQKIGLNLNEQKTEKIYEVSSFLKQVDEDECLEKLSKRFDSIVSPLWILDSEHRAVFASSYHNDELWWYNIKCYQQCLRAIRIYIDKPELSRKVFKYLFNSKSRDRDLATQKEVLGLEGELKSTKPPNSDSFEEFMQWAASFTSSNNVWNDNRNELCRELVNLFQNSWQELRKPDIGSPEIRKFQRYIRFALFRLSILGLNDIIPTLIEILREAFWIIRDPINVLESIARQGFLAEIRGLLAYYQNFAQPVEYLKAITIRAMRFLPNIDAQEWEIIVEFSTISDGSISIAERLMATETWLYFGHKYNDFKQSRHMESVKNALRWEPSPPSRLEKNYLLILGQFEPNAVQEFSVNVNDPMLVDARDLALQGDPSALFDLPELKILRENYYSGQSPTDTGGDGSP
ncbi:Reverse transcriptase domain-containing protein [Tumidithrix helvetica PCC 7403]|uniref:RNA-directed DNA polymerase n=1 Tax=Tumidithrix helvetica TaxID=3457545 RepID=UPI003CA32609